MTHLCSFVQVLMTAAAVRELLVKNAYRRNISPKLFFFGRIAKSAFMNEKSVLSSLTRTESAGAKCMVY